MTLSTALTFERILPRFHSHTTSLLFLSAVIMEEVELTAMGVATAPEVFNDIMERFGRYEQHPQTPESELMAAKVQDGSEKPRKLSALAELQVVRAIGVAIVLEGSMHPTMELLLRHAIQYFGMKGKPILVEPRNLDSVPRFLSDMAKLSPDEQLVVMCVHLLTMMLDGEMDEPVRRFLASSPQLAFAHMYTALVHLSACLRANGLYAQMSAR